MKSLGRSIAGAVRGLSVRPPAPLVGPGYTSGSGWSIFGGGKANDVRLMETYGQMGTVYAIVNRLASATSAVDWHLYRKAASGKKEDRTEVTSHAALDLINRPNKFMTRQEMIETGQQHIDLTGEADLMVSKFGSLPLELWPIRPDRVTPVPDPWEFLAGYIYQCGGEMIPMEVDEIIQLRMPNPLDPYCGLGPVQSILTDIDSSRYSAEWNKNFFLNSAEPGGIVQVDKRLGDDEFREMRDRWAEQHKGVSKAHRVAILEQGAQWVDRKMTQRDMEFTSLAGLSRDKILEAFGFPKAILGIVEDVNRASFEGAEYLFEKWLVVVRLERWKLAFNNDILPMYAGGDQLEFDYDSPVPENSDQENAALTAKWDAVVKAVPLGFDAAAMLEALGLPAIPYTAPAPPQLPRDPAVIPGQIVPNNVFEMLLELGETHPVQAGETLKALLAASVDNAMRWEAVEENDDSTCQPCKDNDGKLYRNREDAYKDYPDGEHFVNCVGEEYGNHCRGYVRKRKQS